MMRPLPWVHVALFALAGIVCSQARGGAQEPGSAAWKQLQQNPKAWPVQVRLKVPVELVITKNGQKIGQIGAPADSMVQVLAVEDATLRVAVGSAQASIAPDQTDFADRLAAAAKPAPAATNVAPVATALTTTATPATPAPPAPMKPAQPPTASTANTSPLPPVSGPPMQFDFTAPPEDGYEIASYHFWSPAYSGQLRGLIIMTPGSMTMAGA